MTKRIKLHRDQKKVSSKYGDRLVRSNPISLNIDEIHAFIPYTGYCDIEYRGRTISVAEEYSEVVNLIDNAGYLH